MQENARTDYAATTIGDVRRFLDAQGSGLAPWSSGHEALDGLVALLEQRADDPAFWDALAPLLRRLSDRQIQPELITGSEVLDGASLEVVLGALRQSLAARTPQRRSARDWARGVGDARALAGFMLLSAAVACTGSSGKDSAPSTGDSSSGDTAVAPCDEAVAAGLTDPEEMDVWCALVDIIREADISDWSETSLLECLSSFTAAERRELLDEFTSLSEADLATLLSNLAHEQPLFVDTGDGGH